MDITTVETYAELQVMSEDNCWDIANKIVNFVDQYDLPHTFTVNNTMYEVMTIYRKDVYRFSFEHLKHFRLKKFLNLPKEKKVLVISGISGNIFVIGAKEKDIRWYSSFDPSFKILTIDETRNQWFLNDLDRIVKNLKTQTQLIEYKNKRVKRNISKAQKFLD